MLNIKLFQNFSPHSQKYAPTPCHTLSQKAKSPTPLCVTEYVNSPEEDLFTLESCQFVNFTSVANSYVVLWQIYLSLLRMKYSIVQNYYDGGFQHANTHL